MNLTKHFIFSLVLTLMIALGFTLTHPAKADTFTGQTQINNGLPYFATGPQVFSSAVSGTAVDVSAAPTKVYALFVGQSVNGTTWDFRLEGSLDGQNWQQLLRHASTTGQFNNDTVFTSTAQVVNFVHIRAASLAANSTFTARANGIQ